MELQAGTSTKLTNQYRSLSLLDQGLARDGRGTTLSLLVFSIPKLLGTNCTQERRTTGKRQRKNSRINRTRVSPHERTTAHCREDRDALRRGRPGCREPSLCQKSHRLYRQSYSFSAAAPVYTGRAEAWWSMGAPVRLAAEVLRWRATTGGQRTEAGRFMHRTCGGR